MSKKPKKKRLREYVVEVLVQLVISENVKASSRKRAAQKALNMALENGELSDSAEPLVTVFKRAADAGNYPNPTGYGTNYDVIDGELRLRK